MGMRPWGYMQGEAMEEGSREACHGNEAMGIYAGGGYGSRGPEEACHGNEAMGIYAGGGEQEEEGGGEGGGGTFI